MTNKIFLLICLVYSFNNFAQHNYQKGYYIDNDGQKHEIFIKNSDWKNNPSEIKYKTQQTSEPQLLQLNNVKEFSINGQSKYVRRKVQMERSSEIFERLSQNYEPEYREENVFLKVLVEGKASLFYYEDGKLRRFFYQKTGDSLNTLIYKSYQFSDNSVGTNNGYIYQLWKDVRCGNITIGEVQKVEYRKDELVKFFTEYNRCEGSEITTFENKENRDLLNLAVRPGINLASFRFRESYTGSEDIEFENVPSIRLGVELESVLPFQNGRWAFVVEPGIQIFKSNLEKITSIDNTSVERRRKITIDYKSLEIPLGIRYYILLKESSRLFLNGFFVLDNPFDSSATFDPGQTINIKTGNNLAFGLGYKYNERLIAEIRYITTRKIFNDYLY